MTMVGTSLWSATNAWPRADAAENATRAQESGKKTRLTAALALNKDMVWPRGNVTRHREPKFSPLPHPRQLLIPIGAPRPMCSRVTTAMAGLLARGSLPCAAFPVSQWHIGARLAAYSCGGSCGFGLHPEEESLTAFPFNPRREPSETPSTKAAPVRSIQNATLHSRATRSRPAPAPRA